MTSPHDSFRVTASIFLGSSGIRSLSLQASFSTDPSQAPVLLEWMEFDRVRLRLESPDQDSLLELEGYDGQIPAGSERIVPGVREQETDAYPWYPGVYELRVTVDGTVWYGLFRIRPRHLEADQLAQLRQDLERVVGGLSLDVSESRGYQGHRPGALGRGVDGVRLRQLNLLRTALAEVAPAMRLIEQEPQHQLGRQHEVVPWHHSQRLDGKSFRWLTRGEWLREPRALPSGGWNQTPRAVLAPAVRPSYDTYENRVARFILESFVARARTLRRVLLIDLLGVERELQQAERSGWDTRLLRERRSGYLGLQPLVAEVEKRFGQLASLPWFTDVGSLTGSPTPTTTLLKDSRYRALFRWYQRVEEALVTVDTGELFQMKTKRTSTLYEYWSLFRVIELFGELGFRLTDGGLGVRLREANRDRLIPIIEPGTAFWLEDSRGRRLRVVYDQALPITQDQALEQGFNLYIANPKNRPDIRVDFMTGGQPVRCLVLDAKYRRLASIWNSTHPEVVYQLLSYAGNLYHVLRPRIPLTQVAVALYPGSGLDPDWQERESGGIALARMAPNRPADDLRLCFQRFVGDELGV